ncbi:MAG: hypothetical protein AAGC60_30420 [Acidobacteriota bacterium]
MAREPLLAPRLVLLFLVGCLLFGYPLMELFSGSGTLAGIPVFYVYLFVAWAAFIAVLAWLASGRGRRR